jgi:hypothetical protein
MVKYTVLIEYEHGDISFEVGCSYRGKEGSANDALRQIYKELYPNALSIRVYKPWRPAFG